MKTVIYHSADYDGIFCREIAKKFLGEKDVQYIGWNFGDPPVQLPINGEFVIMDLPIDKVFGVKFANGCVEWPKGDSQPFDRVDWGKFTWIDHHKSSIEGHPTGIPGYRIDGVAACRLTWQWFNRAPYPTSEKEWCELPCKEFFIDRKVKEPLAVRLAGEYDVWDKRDWRSDALQYGLRSSELKDCEWQGLLSDSTTTTKRLVDRGNIALAYAQNVDASICNSQTYLMDWEGLTFLCVNHARFNSLLFAAKDVPETGHHALLGYRYDGKNWLVSLYHAAHRKDLDLSTIAVKYGGGGHRGACGFTCSKLPFM